MSDYWAGGFGTGLYLSSDEFDNFVKTYKGKNPHDGAALDVAIEYGGLGEFRFLRSDRISEPVPFLQESEDPDIITMSFLFDELNGDNVSGLEIWPFYRKDGTMNVRVAADGSRQDLESCRPMDAMPDLCYVLWGEKDMCGPEAFDKKPYDSYGDFVKEFQDKLSAYLPEDFDWNAHIGNITFASYG